MSDRLNRSFFRFCVACRSYKAGLDFVVYENVILDVSVVTVYVVDFVGNEILLLRVAYYRARIDGSGNIIDGDMRISIGISYRGFAAEITYKSADIAARKSAAFVCDSYVCEYLSVSVAYYARARRLTGKTAYACVTLETFPFSITEASTPTSVPSVTTISLFTLTIRFLTVPPRVPNKP